MTAEHVEKAINEKVYRTNRIEERLQEMILEGTIIIDTEGAKVGQINGLAVLDMGDYSFRQAFEDHGTDLCREGRGHKY